MIYPHIDVLENPYMPHTECQLKKEDADEFAKSDP